MSWETSKRVWENVPLSVTKNERLALLALAERSDKYGVCWPGYEDIGRLVGVDPRSAMRLIKSLEKQKQILILHQMGMRGGRGYTNLYLVITGLSPENINEIITNHPSFNDKGDKIDTLLGYKKGDKTDIKGVETVTHNQDKGDKIDTLNQEKGDNFDKKGDKLSPEPIVVIPVSTPPPKISFEDVWNRWFTKFGDRLKPNDIQIHSQLIGDYFDENPDWTFKAVNETVGADPSPPAPIPYFKRIINGWIKLGYIPEREPATPPPSQRNGMVKNGHDKPKDADWTPEKRAAYEALNAGRT